MKKMLSIGLSLVLLCSVFPVLGWNTAAASSGGLKTFFADFADLAALVGDKWDDTSTYTPNGIDTDINAWVDARFGVFVNREDSQYKQKDYVGQRSYGVVNFEKVDSRDGFVDHMGGSINLRIGKDGTLGQHTFETGDHPIRKSHALTIKNGFGDYAELSNFEAEIVFNKAGSNNKGAVYVSFHEKDPGKMLYHSSKNMRVISGNEAVIVGSFDAMTDGVIVGGVANTNTKTEYISFKNKLDNTADYKLTVKVVGTALTATVTKISNGSVVYTGTNTIEKGSGSLSVGLGNCPRNLKSIKVTELDANGKPVDFGQNRSMQAFNWTIADKGWYAENAYWSSSIMRGYNDYCTFADSTTQTSKEIITALNRQFVNVYNRNGRLYTSEFGKKVSYEGQEDNYAYFSTARINKWLQFTTENTTGNQLMRHISSLVPKGTNGEMLKMQNFETTFEARITTSGYDVQSSPAIVLGFRQQEAGKFTSAAYVLNREQAMLVICSEGYTLAGGEQIPITSKDNTGLYNRVQTTFSKKIAKGSTISVTVRAIGEEVYLKIVNKGTDGSGNSVLAEVTKKIPYVKEGALAYGISNKDSEMGDISLVRLNGRGEEISLYGCVKHVYDGGCDLDCNTCGEVRAVSGGHTYDSDFDAACKVCKEKRFSYRGKTGTCIWTLNDTTLTISGNGAMGNYTEDDPAPWGTDITTVFIRDGVTSVGDMTFFDCKNLTLVQMSDSVTSIGKYAFSECWDLQTITIPDNVTNIGERAFDGCESLLAITIPEGVTVIPTGAFYECLKLAWVEIPDTVQTIGDFSFAWCRSLTVVKIPDSVTTLGVCAFTACDKLTNLTIGKGVTTIANEAFSYCLSLNQATIPDGVTAIGANMFYECRALRTVNLGKGVRSVGNGAFINCKNLTKVNFAGTQEDKKAMSVETNNNYFENASWRYSVACMQGHTYDGWTDSQCNVCNRNRTVYQTGDCYWQLEDGVLTIGGNGAMADYTRYSSTAAPWQDMKITKLVIEDGVTSIGNYAFCDTALQLVEMADSVTRIGDYAFYHCPNIPSIKLSDSVTTIGESAFSLCWMFSSIELPDSLRSIGDETFKQNELLVSVILPDSLETIGDSAFENCGSIKTINMPRGVTKIGTSAFLNTGVEEVWCDGTDRADMLFSGGNSQLVGAEWHYNACADGHTYDHKMDAECDVCYYIRPLSNTGWVLFDGKWYFYENGVKVSNAWRKDSKGWVYLGADGAMLTNKWCKDSKGWCYVGSDGYAVTDCWKKDSKGWIYFDANGSMTKSKWILSSGKWYYVDANGYMVTNKWMKDSKGWVKLGSKGAMLTNQWTTDSKGWCYVGANGYAVTNCWKKDNTGWIYLNGEGSMTKSKWIQDGGKWYYLDSNGYMVANKSMKIGNKTYKFNAAGVCTNP